MSDAEIIVKNLAYNDNISFPVLIPNIKGMVLRNSLMVLLYAGFDNFYAATNGKMKEIAVFTSASESFSVKNTNCSIVESLERLKIVTRAAKNKNIRVRGYVSCIVKCPYEGLIDTDKVLRVTTELLNMGCYEVSLGDTIGAATPGNKIYKSTV